MTHFAKQGPHKKADCSLCHQRALSRPAPLSVAQWKRVTPTQLDLSFPIRGRRCVECHRDEHNGNFGTDCELCHRPGDFKRVDVGKARSMRPLDHRGSYIRRHAALAETGNASAKLEPTCAACHGSKGCSHCHLTAAPSNHTAIFRARTHGAVASFDQSRCSLCHQQASCTMCHRRTPPLNHRGAWRTLHGYAAGGFGDSNCFVCHRRADCALCHRAN